MKLLTKEHRLKISEGQRRAWPQRRLAATGTPSQRVETEKRNTLTKKRDPDSTNITQHNITSTVLSGRKEGRKEEEFDTQGRGA